MCKHHKLIATTRDINGMNVCMNTARNVVIPGGLTWSFGDNSRSFTLTCISTGGPATTVTWTRDSATVTQGNQTVLNDPVTAQYTHTLTVTGALGGVYTCTVANNKPSRAAVNITIGGMFIHQSCCALSLLSLSALFNVGCVWENTLSVSPLLSFCT